MQPVQDNGGDAVQFEPFTPPPMEELDALIPGYKFIEFIDRGGMGAVYKAVQKSLNRPVAVKLLPQVNRNKESFADRFKREAHALALLNHPNIIAVHDFGETADGQMYYAMEFVSGMDLQHLLKRDPPEPKQILKIIKQVCDALQFAHERGIVHRDIKPANILIDERGNVKVADFGLAKLVGPQSVDFTATGTTLGTPDYIAPEALDQHGKIDHRADIYSLGVMIYELFTGHVPKGMWEPPSIRSGTDKRLDVVVSTAMQNDPDKRYQHVSDMTQVLEKLLKTSDNWKNYRRPRSEVIEPPLNQIRIPSDAKTLLIPRRGVQKSKWMVLGVLVTIVLAGLTTAWQAGWWGTPSSGSRGIPAQQANSGAPATSPSTVPEQSQLADWVFAHGGFVNVQTASDATKRMGDDADIYDAKALPAGSFTVWRVSMSVAGATIAEEKDLEELVARIKAAGTVSNLGLRGTTVPTNALRHLQTIETLTNLDVMASPAVTADAIPFLAACKRLTLLRIGGSQLPVDAYVTTELRALLPDCAVNDTD